MKIRAVRTRIFKEGEDLFYFIRDEITGLKENSVLVITSKIVALAEGRTVAAVSRRAKERLIRKESEFYISAKPVWLTLKDGMFMASAGIDESNARGKLILLPKDSFKTAAALWRELRRHYRVKNLGILITDSHVLPLRAGVVGAALGYAGFCGVKDYRGRPDIYGRKFVFSRVNVADSLATAAALEMGEGRERQPLAIIENPPVKFLRRINPEELLIDIQEDMYQPLFSGLMKRKR